VEKSSIEGDQTKLKKTMRKLSHRKVEKNRRDKLGKAFVTLGTLLKCSPKADKLSILEAAIKCISKQTPSHLSLTSSSWSESSQTSFESL